MLELNKVRYIQNGTTQHFNFRETEHQIKTLYITDNGYYIFYANRRMTQEEMISSIITNNLTLHPHYF